MAFRTQRMALGATNRPSLTEFGGVESFGGGGASLQPQRYRASASPQELPPATKSPERLKTQTKSPSPKASSPKVRMRTGSPAMSERNSPSSPDKYFTTERQAFSSYDQAHYQSGVETNKSTPRELGWSRVKDEKFEPTATAMRLLNTAHQTKPLMRTVPRTQHPTATTVLDRQCEHFFPVDRIMNETKRLSKETRSSTEWVDLSKVSWGEVFPGGDRLPTDRHTKSFSVEGWGPGARIDFDAFPTNQFMPDVSALLTSRVITRKTPPTTAGAGSTASGTDRNTERAARWDPFSMTNTQRIALADGDAKEVVREVQAASRKSKDGALASRDMVQTQPRAHTAQCLHSSVLVLFPTSHAAVAVSYPSWARRLTFPSPSQVKLQQSLTYQHGVAEAVKTIEESQRQEGHMKGVIAKPTNFKRPFSPVDFSVLTTTKLGRPMGEPLIGVGTHVHAGLPTNLRYNQRPDMIEVGNHCVTRKGHSNNFPFHSGNSAEGYIKGSRILKPGEFIKNSHTLHPNKEVFRPSFDKGVEMDGQLAKGKAPRELTLYHCVGHMRN